MVRQTRPKTLRQSERAHIQREPLGPLLMVAGSLTRGLIWSIAIRLSKVRYSGDGATWNFATFIRAKS